MQRIPCLLLFILLAPALSLAAMPQRSTLTPQLTAVTVYQDRAPDRP